MQDYQALTHELHEGCSFLCAAAAVHELQQECSFLYVQWLWNSAIVAVAAVVFRCMIAVDAIAAVAAAAFRCMHCQ